MTYEELLIEADKMGLEVKEKLLKSSNGRIKNYKVAIRKNIPTLREKACVLAEEIGHYLTSVGDILDQSIVANRKQEHKARMVAYDIQIGINGIIEAYEAGCTSVYMAAEYLEVTENFLRDAIEKYRMKYGIYTKLDKYIVYFEPTLGVMKLF